MSNREFNTTEVVRVVKASNHLANVLVHEYTTVEHLTYVLLNEPAVQKVLADVNVDVDDVKRDLDSYLRDSGHIPMADDPGSLPRETAHFSEIVQRAVAHAMFSGMTEVKVVDLLVYVLQAEDSFAASILMNNGLDLLALKRALSHGAPQGSSGERVGPQGEGQGKEISSKEEAVAFLAKFTTNLNDEAGSGKIDPIIGRETEIDAVIQTMARRRKNNVIMVGEPGVGKTALAEGLALKIKEGNVPEVMLNSTVFSLELGNLIAGTKFRGDFEERMKQVLKALTFVESPILFIDEIHMMMGAGSGNQGTMDVANLLKPALAKGELRCLGSTTYEEFRKHFEKDRALLRRFQRLDINEPSIEDSKRIIAGLRSHYESFHGVSITDEAIAKAVELTHQYVHNRHLPDKAIDVIDSAGARQRVAHPDVRVTTITGDLIEREVSLIANIPEKTVKSDERDKLMNLHSDLTQAVFDQDEAIDTLVDHVMVNRSNLRDENKPAGAFLFVGPTGVGKTEAAKQLANTLGVELVRFDMSEYMEKHSVSKLIGSPPGYVGHNEGGAGSGLLINAVDSHPHCVLLLDEIEKAHPDIFNVFLQVFDDGRLTSSTGKTVHFNNVYVIMSSNAGARRAAAAAVGFTNSNRVGEEDVDINKFFSPEFRNRLDAIVKFKSLTRASMEKVVDKFMAKTIKQAAKSNVELVMTAEARTWLAENGYDEKMGARPLDRLITKQIKVPLSRVILFQNQNAERVVVDVVDDKLKLTVTKKTNTQPDELVA